MMKNIVVLYAGSVSGFAFDKCFGGSSAFDRALAWAQKHGDRTFVLASENPALDFAAAEKSPSVQLVRKPFWTNADVASEISALCRKNDAPFALFSWADTPFLSGGITEELVREHTECLSEYTFADGFPYGIAPEVIDAGTAGIVAALAADTQKSVGERIASRDGLFSIMKGDINAFEIETLIADKDYRLLRLEFECTTKINFLACRNLYDSFCAQNGADSIDVADVYRLCNLAEKKVSVQKTVPAFYNVQITKRTRHNIVYNPQSPLLFGDGDMTLEDFRKLVGKISAFSGKAVVSLSCFGEPLLHADFAAFANEVLAHDGLSLLVETDGIGVDGNVLDSIDKERAQGRIDWIVLLDAAESALYAKIHGCPESDFSRAVNAVPLLESRFPGHVWPQFVRMKMNEHELEGFYRFWKEKENPSGGNLIIQKYDHFCALLGDEKVADLSPLNRIPCWHLKRDMTILCDGTVPICRDQFDTRAGNAFEEELGDIWKRNDANLELHLAGGYPDKCKVCDEYYTFVF
ncbi:MAG: spiro-SPASM protein [Treponema sp.]|nr:spiro-SPASM protein [Treponema sp.]